jgi:enamine deaminase RidA (YjgF/YER057c/UK114 family)
MQYSLHPPSPFISKHCKQLLPEWSQPVRSLLIVIQPSPVPLIPQTAETEACKQALRQKFLAFGLKVAAILQQQGYLADVFDPRSGFPVLSQAGSLRLDDVAVASRCLGYPTALVANCTLVRHPTWGEAVYPSTLVSSAQAEVISAAIDAADGLVECHQSFNDDGNLS